MNQLIANFLIVCLLFADVTKSSGQGRLNHGPNGSKSRPRKGPGDQTVTDFFERFRGNNRLQLWRFVVQAAIEGNDEIQQQAKLSKEISTDLWKKDEKKNYFENDFIVSIYWR